MGVRTPGVKGEKGLSGPPGRPGLPGNFAGASAPEETEVIQGPIGSPGKITDIGTKKGRQQAMSTEKVFVLPVTSFHFSLAAFS